SAGSAGTHRLANEAATESAILIAVFSGFQAGSPKSRPHLYATIARNPVYTDFSGESFAAPQTQDSPVHECCTPLRAAIKQARTRGYACARVPAIEALRARPSRSKPRGLAANGGRTRSSPGGRR